MISSTSASTSRSSCAPLLVTFLLCLLFLTAKVSAECTEIGPAVIKGKRFFDSRSGKYIPLKGINYYPRPNAGPLDVNAVDFFTDEYESIWRPDIERFRMLNINVIRIFAVDPSKSHDGFMCALKQLGIYVVVGLAASCDDCHIINDRPPPDCYPAELKSRGQFIINTFSRYDNTLAFSAGNEVNLESAFGQLPEYNAACQKQFLRDMRAFIQGCPLMRKIPVGLSLADIDRVDNAMYYTCRTDPNDTLENAEFYGLNVYQHCNGEDPCIVGFLRMLADFQNMELPIPVLLTEFGCVDPSFEDVDEFEAQRDFRQVPEIYSDGYAEEFAGAFAFEYSTERWNAILAGSDYPFTRWGYGNYGIGYFSPKDCDHIDIPCTYVPFPQFETLVEKFSQVDASFIPDFDDYVPRNLSYPECPKEFNDTLSEIPWGSADIPDDGCAWWPTQFVCPNTPSECLDPTIAPTDPPAPSSSPTKPPSVEPTSSPTSLPSTSPSLQPTMLSTDATDFPSGVPTKVPSDAPTQIPSASPTNLPSVVPGSPTVAPTTGFPTMLPSSAPTLSPSTLHPSESPTHRPSVSPTTMLPSVVPGSPTTAPSTGFPTVVPTSTPGTVSPTILPTVVPTSIPTNSPTSADPTLAPTTKAPTIPPVLFLPTTTIGSQGATSGAVALSARAVSAVGCLLVFVTATVAL